MVNIASIFAKSPFKSLRDHMDKVVESVVPLNDFFEALFQEDYSKLEKIQQVIEHYSHIKMEGKVVNLKEYKQLMSLE